MDFGQMGVAIRTESSLGSAAAGVLDGGRKGCWYPGRSYQPVPWQQEFGYRK